MSESRRGPAFFIPVLIFAGATLAGLVVLAQGFRMQAIDETWGTLLLKWGAGITIVSGLPLALPHRLRANLSVSFVMMGLCAFGFNVFLAYTPPPAMKIIQKVNAKRDATPGFDKRHSLDVVRDMRADGIDAMPPFVGTHRLADDKAPDDLFPLIGVSTATTVLCNETGKFAIYTSDEHGFNNPQNLPEQIDVLLVGDSFMHGQCMHQGKDIAGLLRGKGYSVYSIGGSGNGALIELGSLIEYGLRKKPKVVIWGYAGNDPNDTRAELVNPLLRKYLDEDGFTQNLIERQPEINAYWKDLLVRKDLLAPKPPGEGWSVPTPRLSELVTLYSLRKLLGLRRGPKGDWRTSYRAILVKGRKLAEAQGAKVYFLPFPYYRLVKNAPEKTRKIFGIVEPTGLTMIDMDTVFYKHPDRLNLFPLGLDGHYSEAGYALVTEGIIDNALTPNGIAPRSP